MRQLTGLVILVFACSGSEGSEPVFPSDGGNVPGMAGIAGSASGGSGPTAGSGGRSGPAPAAGSGGTSGSGASSGSPGGVGGPVGGSGGQPTGPAAPGDGGGSPESDAGTDAGGGASGADAAPSFAGNPFVYVGSSTSPDIRIFELDMESGALRPRGMARSGPSPNYFAFHPNGRFFYAISEQMSGRIFGFSVDAQSGALTRINDAASGGTGPAHLSVHRSGKWLLVANYGSGHAAVLPISPEGQLGAPVTPSVLAGRQAHMILDDGATGKFVFVPSKGDLRTLMYRFDETTGALTPSDPPSIAQGGPARHMAFHRSGLFAYVLTEGQQLGRRVFSYRYDPATGLLSGGMPHVVSTNMSTDGAHILVHPTLDVVYASIRGLGPTGGNGSIARLPIGSDGRLGAPTHVTTQIARPWDFDIDRSGRYLVVANNDAANVRVFRIAADTGALSLVGNGANVAERPRVVAIFHPPRAP